MESEARPPHAPRPNFFIVGAPKCGTSAMHEYLAQHPDVFMSRRKEMRHFSPDLDSGADADANFFIRDRAEYLAHFAEAGPARVIGESSPGYLFSTVAARLIKEFAPAARILVMLRDPVEMIQARHAQRVFGGREELTDLAAALAAEAERRAGRRLPRAGQNVRGALYVEACTMAPQVRRYLDAFGRQQVLVETLEDLRDDAHGTYRRVLEFLGLDPSRGPARLDIVNSAHRRRSVRLDQAMVALRPLSRRIKRRLPAVLGRAIAGPAVALRHRNVVYEPRPAIPADLEQQLARQFAPDVAELSTLLERDFSIRWPRFKGIDSGVALLAAVER